MKISIKELVDSVKDKLAFPKIAMRILRLFEEDDISVYQLAKIVSLDPVLAAYILKVANSAFYNFSGKVKTLSDAIALIGFEEVKKIVIMVSAKNAFKVSDEFDRVLWEHSLAVAVASSVINQLTRVTEDGVAYISGLLHDIGKIVFKKNEGMEYIPVLEEAYHKNKQIKELEEEKYGYNHADVGGYLLQEWNFDQEIVDAVSFHHLNFTLKKTSDFLKKAALINVADFVVNSYLSIGKQEKIEDFAALYDLGSSKIIGFKHENLANLFEDIYTRFEALKTAMEEEV
ncbi:HDOD domain-containing protein [Hippea maritima]|uniref:Metal dependent phosphohydrolase n=1 Tax=Hippea maritima (strain ATCC 700847 / DSM 10411 / MH2) TaxID=760142 RepID=F2LVI9_HIPMA|nr:HDOD domain-containing protein [Hippea maritima]AEA33773.1 metal dependent phosphohydrolase [Hippea maritima DSM 10411]